jgi:nucleoid-associated protein EbfC
MKGMGDLGNLMKMQREMKNIQKKLKKTKIEGVSSDGLVKATVNGEQKLLDISIEEELLSQGRKKVEKMVLDAVNDASAKIQDYSAAEIKKLTGDLNIPGM